ncbi:MAG: type I glutamate--ammonia ligase [Anaerobiospirillum succiniciproducens]|uniref:type I glutamate--ammonia ligase n=1 Tax=Anaerobiospirillum succiniciproducens TaxID=13335 RepID=UPI002A7565ED|nr:type I glutamate--ammonia ligase [Anaerobiospirillum succiniciproducens]MDY2797634.1 type I glutamate--ammonia ligase [Anaerobiospirillum succiniciproducens]
MTFDEIKQLIDEHNVQYADLRFTNTKGKEQHITLPIHLITESFFSDGKLFDGSSMPGWCTINKSDMLLMPVDGPVFLDPFFKVPTIIIRCDILDPTTLAGYEKDPRSIARRAENFMRSEGIADEAFLGPELEFYMFDGIRFKHDMSGCMYQIEDYEAAWNSDKEYTDRPNLGHRPMVQGGYFPVPPVDSSQDIRTEMCDVLKKFDIEPEAHHHEVGTAGQNEIATKYNSLTKKADEVMIYKYVVHNVANLNNKTVTFMPKPMKGEAGSGMHCHMSLSKDGKNLFAGNLYGGLSQEALWFIGGIIKHAKSLNAFTNASTNSYKRLVPHFEAPVLLAYSASNRSAAIRIPYAVNPSTAHIEVRFPDCLCNPYLCFAALTMAGLDGIINRIEPGDPLDKNLYDLPPEELTGIPTVADSLGEALEALKADHEYLLAGGVFTEEAIQSYIELKAKEVSLVRDTPHPAEFSLYYSL